MIHNLTVIITLLVLRLCKSAELTATSAVVIPCIGILSGCYDGCTKSHPESIDKYQPATRCIKRCHLEFTMDKSQRNCGFSHAFHACFNCGYYPAHSMISCIKSNCRPQSRLISQLKDQKMER